MARQREREAGAAPRDGRKRRLERCEARLVGGEDDRAAEVDGERGVAGGVCLSQRAIDRGPQLAARRPALVLCRVDELAADGVPADDMRPLSRSTAGATSWPPAVCLRCHPPVRSTPRGQREICGRAAIILLEVGELELRPGGRCTRSRPTERLGGEARRLRGRVSPVVWRGRVRAHGLVRHRRGRRRDVGHGRRRVCRPRRRLDRYAASAGPPVLDSSHQRAAQ